MLTLYVRTGCPYCLSVVHELDEMGLDYEQKNIADEAIQVELKEKGGKIQVPFLVDPEHNVMMYESGDIVEYLANTYCGEVTKAKGDDTPGVCSIE